MNNRNLLQTWKHERQGSLTTCLPSNLPAMKEVDTKKAGPTPHYITHISETDLNNNDTTVYARGHFPSSDPSIASRIDHINVAHMMFFLWNIGHFICPELNVINPRILKVNGAFYETVKPDTDVLCHARVFGMSSPNHIRTLGYLEANIFLPNNKMACHLGPMLWQGRKI